MVTLTATALPELCCTWNLYQQEKHHCQKTKASTGYEDNSFFVTQDRDHFCECVHDYHT